VEVVGEAVDGEDAICKVAEERPDLVFLDIEMPGLTGMQVAASLPPPRPRIIFCTAYDQYAIDAFEHHATDYLLKPVSRRRLARAIERVRQSIDEREQHQRDVADATRTQARLYPQQLQPMSGLDYAGVCRAARGVGGDYYDFLSLGRDRLGIAIGDVSGKGMFAGLLMAGLQARIQSMAPLHGADLGRLLDEVNRSMHSSTDSNRYATFFYGVYDDSEHSLRYVNAGHNPPLLIRSADASIDAPHAALSSRLCANGTVVGLLPDARYAEQRLQLRRGDTLLAYTDGLSEARNRDGEEFGEQRLESLARRHGELGARELCDAILVEVDRFVGGSAPEDDLTLIVARVR
jgi:sigma-B regulation protein RsbU (phosphoserine phosphatase)